MRSLRVQSIIMALSGAICFATVAGHRDGQAASMPEASRVFEIRLHDNDTVGVRAFRAVRIGINRFSSTTLNVNGELSFNEGLYATLTDGRDTLHLRPQLSADRRECRLCLDGPLHEGEWTLDIPEGLLYADMEPQTVDRLPVSPDTLIALAVPGAWAKPGERWTAQAAFSIHDDDSIDAAIASSGASEGTHGGYFSTLFPVLESLGLRGCLSIEGWRCGFTADPPALNVNGRVAKRLQDERGWEMQAHSMTARYQENSWIVGGLDSEEAESILDGAVNMGLRSNMTTSVYDTETRRQYSVNADSTGWEETPVEWIKPYICDYATGRAVAYNPAFSVDYQWGEWFRIAAELGIRANAWVTPGPTSSHANVPLINDICPNGFESDGQTFYNLPPMQSTATRLMMEGQSAGGYIGETDPDNRYNAAHHDFFKRQIDEACAKGAWIVMGLHAYRPCWVNSLPGALVSQGGDYPDAWVDPMEGVDPLDDDLSPRPELGISDWSQWHPCPGTRLYMLWELLKYAQDRGMLNVTSSEGFRRFGNTFARGYYNAGIKIGPDKGAGILGTRVRYPHYIIGADGAENYYNPVSSPRVTLTFTVADESRLRDRDRREESNRGHTFEGVSPDGLRVRSDRRAGLPEGMWIVNGRKYIIK